VHQALRFHHYTIHLNHDLKEQDKASCINFFRKFLGLMDNDEGILDVSSTLEEAHLHSYVNLINFRH
jgi:hypothetical protein